MINKNDTTVYLYILKLIDDRYYCGITNNLDRRFNEHNKNKKSWASKIGVICIVYSKAYDTRRIAAKMEKRIKLFGVKKYIMYLRLNHKSKF